MFDWIKNITESLSYWSLGLLMILENVFPPIPSEVVMPSAGFAARSGQLSFVGVVAVGTLGSLLGTTPWYFAAKWLGEERLCRWIDAHGKWLAINRREMERAMKWFSRWGATAVFLGRMIPGLRTLISVPAGFAQMPFGRFLAFSALSSAVWNVSLAWLGWMWRDNYREIGTYVGWIGSAVISGIAIWWLARLARRRGWFGPIARSSDS
ncbi:MAG: DedA family protein [Pirellulales bacterium]